MKLGVIVLALAFAPAAFAGRDCEIRPASALTVQRALDLAVEVRERLDASGAQVAFIGRAGQDLSPYGLRYSHMGITWRDHPKGTWTVVHQLNQCGTATSDIYDEGLGNFFLDDLWKMEAVVLVPGESTQQRLATLLRSGRHLQLHEPRYNMVAYAYSTRYQNSNQWTLEVLAAADASNATIRSREQAQQWLKLTGYAPTELRLGAMTRLGARLTKANVAFDDHPGELRWADRIRTATVDSVLTYLLEREPTAKSFVVGRR